MSELYSHPRLREITHEQLLQRLEAIRDRRLITAIAFKNAEEKKAAKLAAQLDEKWQKLDERARRYLEKAEEELDKADRTIKQMVETSNHLVLAEPFRIT